MNEDNHSPPLTLADLDALDECHAERKSDDCAAYLYATAALNLSWPAVSTALRAAWAEVERLRSWQRAAVESWHTAGDTGDTRAFDALMLAALREIDER